VNPKKANNTYKIIFLSIINLISLKSFNWIITAWMKRMTT
jgi:hypothetical protein